MRIDAHQHYWSVAHGDYGWLQPMPALEAIYRDFGPSDLRPALDRAGIVGTVLVQAAPSVDETARLLRIAASPESRVLGVVGWCDLLAPDAVAHIEGLSAEPLLVGMRPMLQDLPDARWILQPALQSALMALQQRGLAFDALVKGDAQLDALCEFVERWPGLRVVLDHAGKPSIATHHFDAWAARITRLARSAQVMCKVSGLVTEAPVAWHVDDLRPYVDHLLANFGAQRLMWGSDWPVVNLRCDYLQWLEALDALLCALSADERERVAGRNARDFYRLHTADTALTAAYTPPVGVRADSVLRAG